MFSDSRHLCPGDKARRPAHPHSKNQSTIESIAFESRNQQHGEAPASMLTETAISNLPFHLSTAWPPDGPDPPYSNLSEHTAQISLPVELTHAHSSQSAALKRPNKAFTPWGKQSAGHISRTREWIFVGAVGVEVHDYCTVSRSARRRSQDLRGSPRVTTEEGGGR
ncbi:hypothetical protein MRB53_042283 [Persea americana]|nr:hypothetical protein MRB53_042283 [Persea americana]